jgi:ribosomal protein L29
MKANTLISWLTALLVTFLAASAFVLSYDVLRQVAQQNGVNPALAYLWPLTLDAVMIAASLAVLRGNLNRERTAYPWLLVGAFTAISMAFNTQHAGTSLLARGVFIMPPLVCFLSFELLMGQVKAGVQRRGALSSLADLNAQAQAGRSELNDLAADIEHLTAKRNTLKAELSELRASKKAFNLGNLNDANAARAAEKAEALNTLLTVYQSNPNTSLADAGRAIGRSKGTVANYLNELEQAGRISRNGGGIVVLS